MINSFFNIIIFCQYNDHIPLHFTRIMREKCSFFVHKSLEFDQSSYNVTFLRHRSGLAKLSSSIEEHVFRKFPTIRSFCQIYLACFVMTSTIASAPSFHIRFFLFFVLLLLLLCNTIITL